MSLLDDTIFEEVTKAIENGTCDFFFRDKGFVERLSRRLVENDSDMSVSYHWNNTIGLWVLNVDSPQNTIKASITLLEKWIDWYESNRQSNAKLYNDSIGFIERNRKSIF